jgi:hypothetical protein
MNATDSKKVAGGRIGIGKFFDERIKEFVETFNRTNKQTIDLFEKTLSVYQATSVADAQRRVYDIIESSLSAVQVNVDSALKTNAKSLLIGRNSWMVAALPRTNNRSEAL